MLLTTFSAGTAGTDGGCWIWPHGTTAAGYGSWRRRYVHRIAYEWANGPIPPGHDVHHLCRVRRCFRPSHLVAVPAREHGTEYHADAASCIRGHPYPESRRPGRADCAVCHREDERARHVPSPNARARAERIRALAATGCTRVEIAAAIGVSTATVRRTLLGEVYP